MRITLATDADVGELARLYGQLSENYDGDVEPIRAALRHPTTDVFIAVDGGKLLGTATVSYRAVPSFGPVAYVDDVVVDEVGRGSGLGRRLMEHIADRARRRGCRRIELTSRQSREAANALYTKLGYALRETNAYFLSLGQ